MIYPSQFGGGFPLGATIQGIGLSEPQWVQRDGKARLRSAYSRLSTIFPIGKMTGTARTPAATPLLALVAASPTYFVAPGASGATTTAFQYSTDGVTYNTATTPAFTPSAIEWCGNRFIGLSSAANQPLVTTGDAPNGTWSATTSGPASVTAGSSVSRLSYSASLGRALAIPSGAVSSVYTLDNGSTVWSTRTMPASVARQGGCWTGTRWLIVAAGSASLDASPDATGSWTTVTLLEATSAAQGNIASDGNGTVVVSGCPSGLQVSTDHGATWDIVPIPGIPQSDTWRVKCIGDRFVVPTAQGVAMSLDGKKWFLDTQNVQALVTASCVAKKGAVFAQVQASAVAYTFAESATEFVVPALRLYTSSPAGTPIPIDPSFIKAL